MVKIYDKLVRDRIPEIIEENGYTPITSVLGDSEYRRELYRKLQEECNEVFEATTKEQLLEELADALEVLKAIANLEGKQMSDVVEKAQAKKLVKGGFGERIFLEKTISKEKK